MQSIVPPNLKSKSLAFFVIKAFKQSIMKNAAHTLKDHKQIYKSYKSLKEQIASKIKSSIHDCAEKWGKALNNPEKNT